jgi:hypothetical protein
MTVAPTTKLVLEPAAQEFADATANPPDADRTALDDAAPAGRAVGERYPAGMLATLDAS